jgi:hypothetical protein
MYVETFRFNQLPFPLCLKLQCWRTPSISTPLHRTVLYAVCLPAPKPNERGEMMLDIVSGRLKFRIFCQVCVQE